MIHLGGGSWPWGCLSGFSFSLGLSGLEGKAIVPPTLSLGQIAFNAYSEAQNWKTYDGKKIPAWDKLNGDIEAIHAAWEAAAIAAIKHSSTLSNKTLRDALGNE